MNSKKTKIKEAMDELLKKISDSNQVGTFIHRSMVELPETVPSKSWSVMNRFILHTSGTIDARGYRQWQNVGRQVKKGKESILIKIPCFKKVKTSNEESNKEETKQYLAYYKWVPVFPYESTDGKELDYIKDLEQISEKILQFPLIEISKELGLSVLPSLYTGTSLGSYRYLKEGIGVSISLCTDDEHIYFHELAHAIDHKINPEFGKSKKHDEITAEFVGCYISNQYGKRDSLSVTKEYLEYFTVGSSIMSEVFKCMERAINIAKYIEDMKK